MIRNFSIGILIFCFSLSSVDIALATEVVEVHPIIVQPYDVSDLREINQEIIEKDRLNRDQELAIKGLIDSNQKLTNTALAQKQDASLEKIDQTMINYRDFLASRDMGRTILNSEKVSKYYDLIRLTENVDDMKGFGQTLLLRSNAIEDKYKILTELKDEMTALNEKLKDQALHKNVEKINQPQEDKIRLLTQRLGEMDQRIARYDDLLAKKDQQITELKDHIASVQNGSAAPDSRVDLLKTELEDKITQEKSQNHVVSAKDEIIKQQENQIAALKANMPAAPNSQVELLKSELDNRIAQEKQQENQIAALKANIPIAPNSQMVLLKSELENKIDQEKDQNQEMATLKARVQELSPKYTGTPAEVMALREKVRWLNKVLAVAKDKAEYFKLTARQDELSMQQVKGEVQNIKEGFARHFKDDDQFESAILLLKDQVSRLRLQLSQKQKQLDLLNSRLTNDDRIQLARELIGLQGKEADLLVEKSDLEEYQSRIFEQHAQDLERKIRGLLADHRIQNAGFQNRMQGLQDELDQKEQQVKWLNATLKEKISQETDQGVLARKIQDLESQLKDKENRITRMKTEIQSGQEVQAQTDTLKQQLAEQQNKAALLKQELEGKVAESSKMTMLMGDYQKKLESKDNDYNTQLGQIADLNARLQKKEAQVVKIREEMYDLQESARIKDRDTQSKDLSLSIMQQKMTDEKINEYQDKINGLHATSVSQVQEITNLRSELALARQELEGMPSSDELSFLRTGLEKATAELKQKDALLFQTKANADEYARKFKQQSREFRSLKEELQDASEEINRRNEDLKYKNMEVTRLKERAAIKEGDLQDQIRKLTRNSISPSGNDPEAEKLKQALDKIDEQGRLISVLTQKLQDAGQNVNLTRQ